MGVSQEYYIEIIYIILIMITSVALCIPRVHMNVSKAFIRTTLKKMRFGEIKSIYEKPLRTESDYKRIIINANLNPNQKNGAFVKERIESGQNVKVVYDDYSAYWKMEQFHNKGHTPFK